MFKKGQLAKTKRGEQYVLVLQDENEDNLVDVWGLERTGVNIGDVFDVPGTVSGGWWIKVGRNKVPVTKAEAKVYTTASNHDSHADDSEGGCRK